jgi:hypothetical protein
VSPPLGSRLQSEHLLRHDCRQVLRSLGGLQGARQRQCTNCQPQLSEDPAMQRHHVPLCCVAPTIAASPPALSEVQRVSARPPRRDAAKISGQLRPYARTFGQSVRACHSVRQVRVESLKRCGRGLYSAPCAHSEMWDVMYSDFLTRHRAVPTSQDRNAALHDLRGPVLCNLLSVHGERPASPCWSAACCQPAACLLGFPLHCTPMAA